MSYSFSKSYRLIEKLDLQNLRESSFQLKGRFFILYYKKNLINNGRIAISITKKSGKASYRNQIRRMVRENFRLSSVRNLSVDFIVVFSQRVQLKKFAHNIDEIHHDFQQLLSQLEMKNVHT